MARSCSGSDARIRTSTDVARVDQRRVAGDDAVRHLARDRARQRRRPASRSARCVRARRRPAPPRPAPAGASRVRSSLRSLPVATISPSSSCTANVGRRSVGSLSSCQASRGTVTPVRRRSARSSPSSSGSPGSSSGSTSRGDGRRRSEVAPQRFRQRAQQRDDQLLAPAGHLPAELIGLGCRPPAAAARAARAPSPRRLSVPGSKA